MSKERPQWILSAYGPGRDAPIQLFGGYPREQSFEELRTRHYELVGQNKQQLAVQEAQTLLTNAEQQIQTALNDIDGAIRYIVNGENEHPNRLDVCNAKGATATPPSNVTPNQQSNSTFGQPSGSAQAFERPSSLSNVAQPSSSTPAFGQPSAPSQFGQPSSSKAAFGQPSAPSTFGRPSAPAFGQLSAPASAFGQPSFSPLGQPSAFGQPAALGRPTTSFGQPSSTLGQPPVTFGKPPLPAPTFGQPSAPLSSTAEPQRSSPFGLPGSTNTNSQQPSNPFGQPPPPVNSNTFGKPSAPASAQPNAFGLPSEPSQANVFGKPPAPAQTSTPPTGPGLSSAPPTNPFVQPNATQTTGAFGQPSRPGPISLGQPPSKARIFYANRPVPAFGFDVNSLKFPVHPSTPSNNHTVQTPAAPTTNGAAHQPAGVQHINGVQIQKDTQGKVRSWNGKPVRYFDEEPCYKGVDGSWQKIWFPDGPPIFTRTADLPNEVYDQATKEKYQQVKEYGTFMDGMMPDLPPKREWCTWNF